MARLIRSTQASYSEVSLGRAAETVFRLPFRPKPEINLPLCDNVLSFVGRAGYGCTSKDRDGELAKIRDAWRHRHQPGKIRRAVGLSLWMGAASTAGDRGHATVRLQLRGQPRLGRIFVDRDREFPARW